MTLHATGAEDALAPPQGGAGGLVRVWDPVVRLFHWSLVASVGLAWAIEDPRRVHRGFGYAVAALLAIRLIWGLIGPRHARFADFVRGPRATFGYVAAMIRRREPRHLGHNPAGAVMVLALMALLSAICATGVMMGMDIYFGQAWVETMHKTLVDGLLVLIALHLVGVLLASLRHRENLVKSMITGQKPAHDSARATGD